MPHFRKHKQKIHRRAHIKPVWLAGCKGCSAFSGLELISPTQCRAGLALNNPLSMEDSRDCSIL